MRRETTTGHRIENLDITAIWRTLGGGPLRANRGRAWWRGGDGPNVALDPAGGRWFDHATGIGGGIVALVQVAMGCDGRAALAWLGENFGIATGNSFTAAERREFARRRDGARARAAELIQRRDRAFDVIRDWKRQLLEEYHQLNGAAHEAEDIELLAHAEDVWAALEALDTAGDALLQETDAAALDRLLAERWAA